MDGKNPYAMAKLGLEPRDPQEKSERDCGFYAKYFFLFLSLIQFLIILGLVLFMVYGSPQAGNEKQLQGLSNLLQRAESKADGLGKEVAELKRRLNASQTESALVRKQAASFNASLRSCVGEKAKLIEQQRNSMMFSQACLEWYYKMLVLNMTCPGKVAKLEEELNSLRNQAQTDQVEAAKERRILQDKADQAEKAGNACQAEKLEVAIREEKYRALESKVAAELHPAQQNLEETVRRTLDTVQFRGCYTSEACLALPVNIKSQLSALTRQVEQKVAETAGEYGRLARDKEACGHQLQEKQRQAKAQEQQAEQEKQALRDAQDQAARKAEAEASRLAKDKEELQAQLNACLRIRNSPPNPGLGPGRFPSSAGSTNPFAIFPGGSPPNLNPMVPNAFGHPPPWQHRPAQPRSPSQGSPSLPDQPRFPEPKMIPNQPAIGQPSG